MRALTQGLSALVHLPYNSMLSLGRPEQENPAALYISVAEAQAEEGCLFWPEKAACNA